MPVDRVPGEGYGWAVRVHRLKDHEARVYARTHSFTVGAAASFRDEDPHPSATELLLGALGADLVDGFCALAQRRSVAVDGVELTLEGQLHNPLVHLGVIGEEGHPGFATIAGTLHVSADADAATLQEVWRVTRERSPLWNTLCRCVDLAVALRLH